MMGTSLGRPAQASLIVARTLQIDPHPHPFILDTCRKRKRVSAGHVSAKTTAIPNLEACAHHRLHRGALCP
jgi:hypothetical protein